MRKSPLSWYKKKKLIENFVAGSTARCSATLVGLNPKSSAYYFHRLRQLIAQQIDINSKDIFSGEIEVDESYFGGSRKGKRASAVEMLQARSLYLGY